MPRLFSIVLFLISIQGIGQRTKLNGSYDEMSGNILNSIRFDEDKGRFSITRYRSGPNNKDASLSGTGNFQIKADTLQLIFDNNSQEPQALRKHEIIGQPTENVKVNINVQVIDVVNGEPVNGCSVTFEFGKESKGIGMTDLAGNVMISLEASDFTSTIKATSIGYESDSLVVQTPKNYFIKLFLRPHSKESMNRGQVVSYKMQVISNDIIELTPLNSTADWKSKYKKQKQQPTAALKNKG